MNINLISEDINCILIEEMFRSGTLNEGVIDIIDNAIEIVAGTIGFIPFAGDGADIAMVIKNLVQKDYLGAALFAISAIPEPTDMTDVIAKTLRVIQKTAAISGQEDRVNQLIGWTYSKTPKLTNVVKNMWFVTGKKLNNSNEQAQTTKNKAGNREKKAINIIDKVIQFIKRKWDLMQSALIEFLDMIQNRAQELEPTGGMDEVPGYVNDLTKKIKDNYNKLVNRDGSMGIKRANKYKSKIAKQAKNDKAMRIIYNNIWGNHGST